ncbi:MAG TPA: DUF6438 domain-containing protein [Nitrososphaera sp.]|nr:DUF6438 domain-containing protein [Nitrososphaera sp.]
MMPKDLVIGLERTMCPDFSLFIHGDGKIVYEGRHYVVAKGRHGGQISRAHVKQLLDEFYRIGYFSLKDRYDAVASDSAITKTLILAGGRRPVPAGENDRRNFAVKTLGKEPIRPARTGTMITISTKLSALLFKNWHV